MTSKTRDPRSKFFSWVEAHPELSRRENDPLTQRIARLVAEEREHPHLWFMVAVFRTVRDVEFIEDQLMTDALTWPARVGDEMDIFSVDYMCARIWREFTMPHTADNAYRSCFVLSHLWGDKEFLASFILHGEPDYLCEYPGWGADIAPAVLADLGVFLVLRVSRLAQRALNRIVGAAASEAWTQTAARVMVERIAESAPPHLAIDAAGVEFALRRYEECRGWNVDDESAAGTPIEPAFPTRSKEARRSASRRG